MVQLFPQAPKKVETSTAVMYKDAGHARTFHCCHGAVGQDYYRPLGSTSMCVTCYNERSLVLKLNNTLIEQPLAHGLWLREIYFS